MALDTRVQDFPDWMQPRSPWTQHDVQRSMQMGLDQKRQEQENALRLKRLEIESDQVTYLNEVRLAQLEEAKASSADIPLLQQYSRDPSQPLPRFNSQKSYSVANTIAENFAKSQAGQSWHANQKAFWDRFKDLPGDDQAVINDMLAESRGRITSDIYKYAGQAWEQRPQQTAGITEARESMRLRQEADSIRETDPTRAEGLLRQAALLEGKFLGQKESIRMTTGPNGEPVVEINRGGDGIDAGPTTANKTKLQQDIRHHTELLGMLDGLGKDLRWQDVGVAGVIGEHVLDRALPQIGVKTYDKTRTDNRTKLKLMVQSALRQISPDNRFTENDFDRVAAIVPSSGVFESEEHAKGAIKTLQEVFAERNVRDRVQLGQELDMSNLANAEIGAAVRLKYIPYDEAAAFLKKNR